MTPTLSLIIPTIGRGTLLRTLHSVLPQLLRGDEILVIGDGPQSTVRMLIEQAHLTHDLAHCPMCGGEFELRYFETERTNTWGSDQRQFGMAVATGDYLAFLDDDDTWAVDARQQIAAATESVGERLYGPKPHIFQMRYANGAVLWTVPALREANIGTPMLVVPRELERLGRWSSRYECDFDFARSWGWLDEEIVWHESVIALIDHEERKQQNA
jgi:glycosyltransferase involved in cell wall biosynthesis